MVMAAIAITAGAVSCNKKEAMWTADSSPKPASSLRMKRK